MTRAAIIGAIVVAFALGVGAMNVAQRDNGRTCNAPCVVQFGGGMHEDEFCIDYRGGGTLYVARKHTESLNCGG